MPTIITSPLKRFVTSLRVVSSKIQIWIYLIILSAIISLLLYPNLLVIPTENYSIGDVANKDIKASHDFLVEDKELTKQRRYEAVKSALFVYDFDRSGANINQRIKESFSYARKELEQISSIELEPALRSEKLKDRFYNLESALQYFNQAIDKLMKNKNGRDIVATTKHLGKLIINPNITFNKRETELRKEEAKRSVKPIYFQVKKGEMIVREGEKINPTHLWKLEAEATLKKAAPTLSMALSMYLMIGILLALSYIVLLKRSNMFKGDSKSLIFISVTLLFMFLLVVLYNTVAEEVARGFPFVTPQVLLFAVPITLGAILISIFQGLEVAIRILYLFPHRISFSGLWSKKL